MRLDQSGDTECLHWDNLECFHLPAVFYEVCFINDLTQIYASFKNEMGVLVLACFGAGLQMATDCRLETADKIILVERE